MRVIALRPGYGVAVASDATRITEFELETYATSGNSSSPDVAISVDTATGKVPCDGKSAGTRRPLMSRRPTPGALQTTRKPEEPGRATALAVWASSTAPTANGLPTRSPAPSSMTAQAPEVFGPGRPGLTT